MRIGVDEAGKGPVLGPMIAAAVRGPPTAIPDGVDDSKRLTPARRAALDAALRADDEVRVAVASVEPARIDDPTTDMNTLTVAGHAEALSALVADGDDVRCDAGDVDADRFARRVRDRIAVDCRVRAAHRADAEDAHVAAASVVAKVERDARVDDIRARYADYGDVGSGYPSDRTTREFLRRYVDAEGEVPACARASWSTCDDLLAAAEQSALDEF